MGRVTGLIRPSFFEIITPTLKSLTQPIVIPSEARNLPLWLGEQLAK
jgi:hypothetical protein